MERGDRLAEGLTWVVQGRRRVGASGRGEEESSRRWTAGGAGQRSGLDLREWREGSGQSAQRTDAAAAGRCCLAPSIIISIKYQTETKLHQVENMAN